MMARLQVAQERYAPESAAYRAEWKVANEALDATPLAASRMLSLRGQLSDDELDGLIAAVSSEIDAQRLERLRLTRRFNEGKDSVDDLEQMLEAYRSLDGVILAKLRRVNMRLEELLC